MPARVPSLKEPCIQRLSFGPRMSQRVAVTLDAVGSDTGAVATGTLAAAGLGASTVELALRASVLIITSQGARSDWTIINRAASTVGYVRSPSQG